MADYGIKVSVPGSDVVTAADKDLVYSSKYNGMKILKHNTSGAGSVAHGAGYVPSFINFNLASGRYRFGGDFLVLTGSVTADSTNINFPDAGNYYFVFVDKLA
jgi:hypothetical protein